MLARGIQVEILPTWQPRPFHFCCGVVWQSRHAVATHAWFKKFECLDFSYVWTRCLFRIRQVSKPYAVTSCRALLQSSFSTEVMSACRTSDLTDLIFNYAEFVRAEPMFKCWAKKSYHWSVMFARAYCLAAFRFVSSCRNGCVRWLIWLSWRLIWTVFFENPLGFGAWAAFWHLHFKLAMFFRARFFSKQCIVSRKWWFMFGSHWGNGAMFSSNTRVKNHRIHELHRLSSSSNLYRALDACAKWTLHATWRAQFFGFMFKSSKHFDANKLNLEDLEGKKL